MPRSLTDVSETDHRNRFRVGRCGKHARSAETRARQSRKQTENWADPDKRQRQSELTRARMVAPEVRAKIAARTAEALAREDVKRRQREGLARAWDDPAKRAAQAVLTRERMARWRAERLQAAATVLQQMPRAEREAALAGLASGARGGEQ